MSYDVDKTLIEIFMKEKNLKKSEAEQFLSNLIDTERYKKDVY
jgi:sulfite reductase alpha subunit-like flavoprotein